MPECQECEFCSHCGIKKRTFSSVTSQILQVEFLRYSKQFSSFHLQRHNGCTVSEKNHFVLQLRARKFTGNHFTYKIKLKLLPTTYPLKVAIRATIIYYRRGARSRSRFRYFSFKNEIMLKKSPGKSPAIIPGVYFICALMSESLRNPNLV